MQTVLAQLDRIVKDAIREAFGIDAPALVGVSQNDKFGDYQSNAAMGLVKPVAEKTGSSLNPRAIAEQIKAKLQLGEIASEVTIAGPGFINIRLSPALAGATPRGNRAGQTNRRRNRRKPANGRGRLFRAEHRQGNARRAFAHHRHRRCHQPDAWNFRKTRSSAKTILGIGERNSAGSCWRSGITSWPSTSIKPESLHH